VAAALLALAVASAGAQPRRDPPLGGTAPPANHGDEDLPCGACHTRQHRGVLRMYEGVGGRGIAPLPARMFETRVQCVACHTTPRSPHDAAEIGGETFRPDDAACVTCHGERYRVMIGRWRAALTAMREAVAPKAAAARAALAAAPAGTKEMQARRLLTDAEHNLRFVAVANGAHNPFYAARLLTRSSSWLDEAVTLLGARTPKTDEALVRGGWCAAMCHEPLGLKLKETVAFGGRPLPHARHATELGAACTTCHSAEAHRKLVATSATCSSCHHRPQNDRCESCHRDQAAFYRGTTKTALAPVAPNLMAAAVTCTNCHDFAKPKPRAAIAEACTGCHEPGYLPLLTEWTKGGAADMKAASDAVAAAERAVATARRAGHASPPAEARLAEAREALTRVRAGGVAHNPLAAFTLLARAREAAADATARAARP
jgi:hypothetical protein